MACNGTDRHAKVVFQSASPSAEAKAVRPLSPRWRQYPKIICRYQTQANFGVIGENGIKKLSISSTVWLEACRAVLMFVSRI